MNLGPPTPPNDRARLRQAAWPDPLEPLPGSVPYVNIRPMFVGGAFDGQSLGTFLTTSHRHIDRSTWEDRAASGHLRVNGHPATLETTVRAGSRVEHTIPNTVEPWVASRLRFVYEDDDLVVLSKPAPLPIHPSGRFNKNTLVGLFAHAFAETLRPVHRLDALVSGLIVLARSKASARALGRQFEHRTVDKRYLAGCRNRAGVPMGFARRIEAPIAGGPRGEGGRREIEAAGLDATTEVQVLRVHEQRATVLAKPISGRTNQIRIHLAHAGLPILGDESYGEPGGDTLMLHAHRLQLQHPSSGTPMSWTDRPPDWA